MLAPADNAPSVDRLLFNEEEEEELFEIWTNITFYTPETFLHIFTTFLLVQ